MQHQRIAQLLLLLCVFLVAPCYAQGVTLTAKSEYQVYEPMYVGWTDSGPHQDEDDLEVWNNPHTAAYLHYGSTEDGVSSGNVTIQGTGVPGPYSIEYVRAGGAVAKVIYFNLIANYTLSVPATVVLGQPIVVNYTISQWHDSDDTIVLMDAANFDYNNEYLQYRSTGDSGLASGSVTFNGITNRLPSLKVVFILAADPSRIFANIPYLQVLSGVTLSATKKSFGINDDIVINWTAPSTHGSDHIYLFKYSDFYNGTGGDYIKYASVGDGASGTVTFPAFKDPDYVGDYVVTYDVDQGVYVANLTTHVSVVADSASSSTVLSIPSTSLCFVAFMWSAISLALF